MKIVHCIIIMALASLSFGTAKAQQASFPKEGVIRYDKTVHVKNLLRRHMNSLKDGNFQKQYFEDLISKVAETAVLKKKLSFRGQEVNFGPDEQTLDPAVSNLIRMGVLDNQGKVYQNLENKQSQSVFELAGSNIVVNDSILDVKWKITNEYREIAGYQCRRANGVILDSVYMVAFYTDEIPLSVGPGTVHGLPGMILGFVVPEQHFNIYATKVEPGTVEINNNLAGRRDKPISREDVKKQLKQTLGEWIGDKQFNLMIAALFL